MPTVTSGRGKAVVSVEVDLQGFFFTGDPVGRLQRNVSTVLREEGEQAVAFTRAALMARQRQTGGGYPDVVMASDVTAQPMRPRPGLMRLVVSANYGSHPLVRKYNRWIEDASTNRPRGSFRGYHIYREAKRLVQSHIDGRLSEIARKLVEGLT